MDNRLEWQIFMLREIAASLKRERGARYARLLLHVTITLLNRIRHSK